MAAVTDSALAELSAMTSTRMFARCRHGTPVSRILGMGGAPVLVNEITGSATAATQDTKWSGGELTGFIVLNESTIAPQFIAVSDLSTAGSTNVASLTNWPANTLCKVIRPFKYYLVAGNMTEAQKAEILRGAM
jgi:hypothetical protein